MTSLQEGFQDLYVLRWPVDVPPDESNAALCLVIMKRPGGFLLGLPLGFLAPEVLQSAAASLTEEDALLGPHTVLSVPGVILAEGSDTVPDDTIDVQVVDANADVALGLKLFDPVMDGDVPMINFGSDAAVVPEAATLLRFARDWILVAGQGKAVFYSAEEEVEVQEPVSPKVPKAKQKAKAAEKAKKPNPQQVAEHIQQISKMMPAMAEAFSSIQAEQQRLKMVVEGNAMTPPLRETQAPVAMSMQAFSNLMGAPPKTRGLEHLAVPPPRAHQPKFDAPLTFQEQAEESQPLEGEPSIARAMLEQSRALTSLVSQMVSGDPLLDAHSSGSQTSSKGAQGREKLMKELAERKSDFCLTVMQNACRRLKPASRAPASLQEIAHSDFSMLSYLESFGGYGGSRDVGIMMYALSFILDCAVREDIVGVQEYAALLAVGLEQAAQDQGRWDLAFQLMLLEDPPSQMWSFRGTGIPQTGRARAFAPLCPQRWATVALAYTKEIDYIQTKRLELAKKPNPQPPPGPAPNPGIPPKRKAKFPKAKGVGEGGTQQPDA